MEQWEARVNKVSLDKQDMNRMIMNFLVTEVRRAQSSSQCRGPEARAGAVARRGGRTVQAGCVAHPRSKRLVARTAASRLWCYQSLLLYVARPAASSESARSRCLQRVPARASYRGHLQSQHLAVLHPTLRRSAGLCGGCACI